MSVSVQDVTRDAEMQSMITVRDALTSSVVGGVSVSSAKRLWEKSNSDTNPTIVKRRIIVGQ